MISQTLVHAQYVVVSGLAFGVDAQAHLEALNQEGVTIAVLAHGLDIISPPSHRSLAERIISERGLLISEHPPGVPPRPFQFVKRNRIQSGLSWGSIIVESRVRGGAYLDW